MLSLFKILTRAREHTYRLTKTTKPNPVGHLAGEAGCSAEIGGGIKKSVKAKRVFFLGLK